MSKPKSFFQAFTESGPLIALAVAVAFLVGIVGPACAPILQFRRAADTVATAQQRIRRWWVVWRRCIRPVSTADPAPASTEASDSQADSGGFFQGAAIPEARDRGGAQRAGARRCDGRLARLRPRGCLFRTAGNGRDPQAQDRLRAHQVSAQ